MAIFGFFSKYIILSAQNIPKMKSLQNLCIFEDNFFVFCNNFHINPYENQVFLIAKAIIDGSQNFGNISAKNIYKKKL